ncbi:hypothetical protein HMPREF9419_1486 [Prevotella nigrescens ATCC 33563]|nr:hypothetical protein HMPREF9419_1486 [Prevotella nigrescens ATCC 33563]
MSRAAVSAAIQRRKSIFKTFPINLITKLEKGMFMAKHVL